MRQTVTAARNHDGDWLLLVVALVTVGASMVLRTDTEWVTVFGWQVPELCTIRRLFGVRCPGCGLTRSFVFMGHGEWLQALRMNWLGPVFWLTLAVQIPVRIWNLVRPLR